MNLLIVNDERITADTMKRDIAWENYGITEVFTAYSVEGGKKQIQINKVDILLCDIEMPEENGMALLRWVREENMDMECIFLTCHASFVYAKEAIELGCQNYILLPAEYHDIGTAVKKVVDKMRTQREDRRFQEYGKSLVHETMEQAIERHGEKKSPEVIVSEACDYIRNNIGKEGLSVNEIAEYLYLHPVYLNRIFRKYKENSIGQYIIESRMKLAAELLRKGNLSNNAIAEKVGYRSYSKFHLMFKKYYNCNPSQYAEKLKEDQN